MPVNPSACALLPSNFTNEELEEAVKYCHAQGVKVYVTCNILPHNAELAALPAFLEFCQTIGVDAFIMTDLGVMSMAKKYAPNVCDTHFHAGRRCEL